MGFFSYICNGCNKNLREEEKVVLKHIRHGEVLGDTEGSYNSHGGVYEDKTFRGDHPFLNSHESICLSELELPDSKYFIEHARIYKQVEMTLKAYIKTREAENPYIDSQKSNEEFYQKLNTEFYDLPKVPYREALSGVEAWHSYCYTHAAIEKKGMHLISESDPEQGEGEARKKYS